MNVNSAELGSLNAVKPETAGTAIPTDEQASAASKVVKTTGKKCTGGNTRPLNAYIAYRCYYSPILTTLPQKDISGIMTSFWHFDGSKDKWAVLAKAYTLIRDLKGKTDAPLNIFLKFNAPRAGILNPDDYITKLGWEIVTGPNGGPQLLRDTANDAVDVAASLASHVSIQDILNNSVQHGYITKHDLSALYKQQDDEVFNLATSNMAVRPVATLSDGKAKLGIYDRTFLDRILTEITAANRPFRNTVIPSENLFLTFDPFTVQAFDAFDMGEKMPDEIVTTFDINDWVEFN